jgi:hypothetical protein
VNFDLTSPPTCALGSLWRDAYRRLASRALKQHFGGCQGLTFTFPCMRDEYHWGDHRPNVADPRIPIKNNTEYHGIELHGWQWFSTAQYEEARDHWLLAALWRREDMIAHGFTDAGHVAAIDYLVRLAAYSEHLRDDGWWGVTYAEGVPSGAAFGLVDAKVKEKVARVLRDMEDYLVARGAPNPGFLIPA